MNERTKKLEKLKDVIIVVLFLTTILLLNLTWRSEGAGSFQLQNVLSLISPDVWVPQAEDLLQAEQAVYAFGDATFSIDREHAKEAFDAVVELFRQQSATDVFLVNEVTPQQYRDMFTGWRTMKVSLSCPVPFDAFCDRSSIKRGAGFDQVELFDTFLLSEAAPDSIFVEGNARCWRFIADGGQNLAETILSQMRRTEPVCYTAASLFGNDNLSLLPLRYASDLAETDRQSDAPSDVERAGLEMAEAVFGKNFDFVRRITDSFGNITYMYGYGEKTLTCLSSGVFEYKTDTQEGQDPGFFESLQAAISFTATHGGWGNERQDRSYVLCGSTEEGSGRGKTYTFDFVQTLDGIRILSENGPAIRVKVCGGEVSYYRRDVAQADAQRAQRRETADAANVIAGNSHLIHSVLGGNVLAASTDMEFAFVAEQFRDASAAYFAGEDALKPAWVITMEGGTKFFFGLYDAAPLGFTRE